MSSAATITFEPDTVGIPAEEWQAFCREHRLEHSPQTVGGNVYYQGGLGGVEVHYAEHRLIFSTYWFGNAMRDVAKLAKTAWRRWGGNLSADPEIRKLVAKEDAP